MRCCRRVSFCSCHSGIPNLQVLAIMAESRTGCFWHAQLHAERGGCPGGHGPTPRTGAGIGHAERAVPVHSYRRTPVICFGYTEWSETGACTRPWTSAVSGTGHRHGHQPSLAAGPRISFAAQCSLARHVSHGVQDLSNKVLPIPVLMDEGIDDLEENLNEIYPNPGFARSSRQLVETVVLQP